MFFCKIVYFYLSLENLQQEKVLAYLAPGQTLKENSPEYETLCNYGIINPVPT